MQFLLSRKGALCCSHRRVGERSLVHCCSCRMHPQTSELASLIDGNGHLWFSSHFPSLLTDVNIFHVFFLWIAPSHLLTVYRLYKRSPKKNWILPVFYNWIVFSEESCYSRVLPSNFLWYYMFLFLANKWANCSIFACRNQEGNIKILIRLQTS